MSLGDRVRTARKRMNLSQEVLAARVEMAQSSLSALERGETVEPSALRLDRIAEVLGVDPQVLLHGDATASADVNLAEPQTAALATEELEDQQALLRLYRRLSPSHQRALLAIARALRESERESIPPPATHPSIGRGPDAA